MSIMDKQLLFCESTSIAQNAADHRIVGDYIDLGIVYDHKGNIDTKAMGLSGLFFNVVCEDEAIVAAGSDVVTFRLNLDDDTTPVGGDIICQATIPVAASTINPDGALLVSMPVPENVQGLAANGTNGRRYLAFSVLIGGQNVTAGKVTAWLGAPGQTNGI